MRIVSISDYAINLRIGRSENTGTTYTTRAGNVKHRTVFKEYYKTDIGEFKPEKWLYETKEIIKTIQETDFLEEIKDYVKNNCHWLKTPDEVEEYAIKCLASGAYMYWDDFNKKRLLEHKVFVFEGSDF